MTAQTQLFPCLKDNYGVLVHDPATGATAAIDAPEAAPVEAALAASGWTLTDILVTHHHGDHTGGIAELKRRHHCRVVAPRREADKIPAVDVEVGEGDRVEVGSNGTRVRGAVRLRDAIPRGSVFLAADGANVLTEAAVEIARVGGPDGGRDTTAHAEPAAAGAEMPPSAPLAIPPTGSSQSGHDA